MSYDSTKKIKYVHFAAWEKVLHESLYAEKSLSWLYNYYFLSSLFLLMKKTFCGK